MRPRGEGLGKDCCELRGCSWHQVAESDSELRIGGREEPRLRPMGVWPGRGRICGRGRGLPLQRGGNELWVRIGGRRRR